MEIGNSSQTGCLRQAFDSQHLSKLEEAQTQGLIQSQALTKQWTQYKTDYIALSTRLSTLADRVTYDVMVPLSPLALVPGRLKHTNEIMVLLGDNWFAERSAVQAKEIVDRRIKHCDEMLEKLKKEQELYSSWHEQTTAIQKEIQQPEGNAEIVEEYNEEQEKHWREQHRAKVKSYYEKMAEMRKQRQERESKKEQKTEADIWARLDELELQEELDDELAKGEDNEEEEGSEEEDSYDSEDEMVIHEDPGVEEPASVSASTSAPSLVVPEVSAKTGPKTKKKVSFSSLGDAAAVEKEPTIPSTPTIHFYHSDTSASLGPTNDTVSAEGGIQNPGDIFHRFQANPEPKSILKVKRSTTPTNPFPPPSPVVRDFDSLSDFVQPPPPAVQNNVFEKSLTAVKSDVVEKPPTAMQSDVIEILPTATVSKADQRPTSRFKAAKLASKSQ